MPCMIMCFLKEDKRTDVIEEWYGAQTKAVQGVFISRLRVMSQASQTDWNIKHVKPLKSFKGLLEIRFKADNVQRRILSTHRPNSAFTMLYPATEKNDRFVPPDAPNQAKQRKLIVESDSTRERPHPFKLG
ncbi:hypothetical protein GGR25_001989 [Kaistia hirudinis]|uniref:Uncharacterized protein n=1 Tax=Kaistia hirudinis TaxID=1293440 RepID=A0A840AL12_9HYPH|nr:hypothetical protein [Kaistia hirudinis]